MINLCFGMRTITVTQLPGGSYSHPNLAMDLAGEDGGIDYWYAMGRWKVVGFFGLAGTIMFTHVDENGNDEPVYCADGVQRIVTLALTHSANIYVPRPAIGTIYENGIPMYEEGVKGEATGNHIHVEVANGVQTTKYYDRTMGVWRMSGELNPIYTIFINKAFSKIKSTMGAAFSYCDSLYREDGDEMELHVGLSLYRRDGGVAHVIRPPKGYKLLLLSPSKQPRETALAYINRIGISGYDVYATVNCNYFQMQSGQADAYGQHYGVEYSDVNAFAPKQPQWQCFYELNNGADGYCTADKFWFARSDCQFACSPYAITIHDGKQINAKSSAAGNKDSTYNMQTAIFRLLTGEWCFAVTENKVLPQWMTQMAIEYGAVECFLCDSGGSSQMMFNGADPSRDIYYAEKVVYTGRQIPNVAALVKKREDIPDTGDDEVEELLARIAKLEADNASLRASKAELLNKIDEAIEVLGG